MRGCLRGTTSIGAVSFARKQAAEATVGVFDAALLPMAARIAKVCIDPECIAEFVMVGELGAIVLGQSTAQSTWQRRRSGVQLGTGACGFTVVWLGQQDKS